MSPLDEFHLRLGRLTQAAAQLDFNVGLSVRWMLEHNAEPPGDLLSGNTPFKVRLDALKSLIKKTFDLNQPEAAKDFAEWFKRAHEARALRNDYVHARWGVRGSFGDEEPFAEYVPLNWIMDPVTAPPSIRLPFSEFDQQIEEVRKLTGELGQLQRKYVSLTSPAVKQPVFGYSGSDSN